MRELLAMQDEAKSFVREGVACLAGRGNVRQEIADPRVQRGSVGVRQSNIELVEFLWGHDVSPWGVQRSVCGGDRSPFRVWYRRGRSHRQGLARRGAPGRSDGRGARASYTCPTGPGQSPWKGK